MAQGKDLKSGVGRRTGTGWGGCCDRKGKLTYERGPPPRRRRKNGGKQSKSSPGGKKSLARLLGRWGKKVLLFKRDGCITLREKRGAPEKESTENPASFRGYLRKKNNWTGLAESMLWTEGETSKIERGGGGARQSVMFENFHLLNPARV